MSTLTGTITALSQGADDMMPQSTRGGFNKLSKNNLWGQLRNTSGGSVSPGAANGRSVRLMMSLLMMMGCLGFKSRSPITLILDNIRMFPKTVWKLIWLTMSSEIRTDLVRIIAQHINFDGFGCYCDKYSSIYLLWDWSTARGAWISTKSPGWKTIIFSFIKAVTNGLHYILGELSDLEMTFYRGFIQTHR